MNKPINNCRVRVTKVKLDGLTLQQQCELWCYLIEADRRTLSSAQYAHWAVTNHAEIKRLTRLKHD
jgi:hypothetical protein